MLCSGYKEAIGLIRTIHKSYPHVRIEGIYTLQDAGFNPDFTKEHLKCFDGLLSELQKENLRPKIAHAADSADILIYPESHYDMIRCVIILYDLEYKDTQ